MAEPQYAAPRRRRPHPTWLQPIARVSEAINTSAHLSLIQSGDSIVAEYALTVQCPRTPRP
jgi:hypothetical protein